VETGIYRLDRILRGIGPLTMLSARPKVGKTSFALHVLVRCAVYQERPALFFSAEMSAEQVSANAIRMIAAIDFSDIERGTLEQTTHKNWKEAKKNLLAAPLVVDATHQIYIEDLLAKARHVEADLIVVDFIQLLRTQRRAQRFEQVASAAHLLKELAEEKQCAVLVLSQLQRWNKERGEQMDKWSSEIEETADQLVRMTSQSELFATGEPDIARRKFTVVQRNGPAGECWVDFHKRILRFEEAEDDEEKDGQNGRDAGKTPTGDSESRDGAGQGRSPVRGTARTTQADLGMKGDTTLAEAEDVPEGEIPF
jgi:replicative DNA helicase